MGHRDDSHYESLDYGTYDPHHLLDSVLDHMKFRTDADLAEALDVPPALIEDIRLMRRPVDAALLVRLHELTDLDINMLRNMLGDRRKDLRGD